MAGVMSNDWNEAQNPDALVDGVKRQPNNPNDPQQKYGVDLEWAGELIEMEESKVPDAMVQLWDDGDPIAQPRRVRARVNRLRRLGVPNVKAQVQEGVWSVYKAPGVTSPDHVPAVNKMADLTRKLESFLFSDPPQPDAQPFSGDDADIERAEMATQVLKDEQGPTTLNTVKKCRRAWSRAATDHSAFLIYRLLEDAGDLVPMRIEAGIDPATGRAAQTVEEAVNDPMVPYPLPWPEYRSMYVKDDGTLTEEESEAALHFLPALRSRIASSNNVRLFPRTGISDIGEAHAMLVGEFITMADLRDENLELYEDLKASEDRLKTLLDYRPKDAKDLLAGGRREKELEVRKLRDDALVWRLEYWQVQCKAYPKGCHIVTYGKTEFGMREDWVRKLDGRPIRMLIPAAQMKQLDEGREDVMGVGICEILGPGNELRTATFAAYIEVLDKSINAKTFIPTISPVHPSHFNNGAYKYLPITPGSQPIREEVPQLDPIVPQVFELISAEMNTASNLEETAQAGEDPNVQSGRHLYGIIAQTHVQLSEMYQNIAACYERACMIELQLIQTGYRVEQMLQWEGEDGEYRRKAWRGADLGRTSDVKLASNSLTMLSPAQKEQQSLEYARLGLLKPHELRAAIRGNVGAKLGIESDPHVKRVLGQIARVKEGPPKNWQPPQQPEPEIVTDPMSGLPVQDPMTGMPQYSQAPAPPDPILSAIFSPSGADVLPGVAEMRLYEWAKFMATKKYFALHPLWKQAVDMEFERAKQSVFPPPAPTVAPGAGPALAAGGMPAPGTGASSPAAAASDAVNAAAQAQSAMRPPVNA